MQPLISVALATCNGSPFLPELLESLSSQHLTPGELVVSDDASDDNTFDLLKEFSRNASFPVRILRNQHRLGIAANFSVALKACRGDWIAMADQDDVWFPGKLEKLARALEKPDVIAAFSDALVVDEMLRPLGYTMWQRVHFTERERWSISIGEPFSVLLKHTIVTGATMAVKARLLDLALPIPEHWQHDAWLALVAANEGALWPISESLMAYRQHSSNAVGGRRKNLITEIRDAFRLNRTDWYRNELAMYRSLEARLKLFKPNAQFSNALAEKISHLERRLLMPASRWKRMPAILKEIKSGNYKKYSRNWGSIAIDLIIK